MGNLNKTIVGWREHVDLPSFEYEHIPVKLDTGAQTTAIHATEIEVFEKAGEHWVSFLPNHHVFKTSKTQVDKITVRVHSEREVTNTSGVPQMRVVIKEPITLNGVTHCVEMTLADRTNMKYPLILGRSTLAEFNALVDSSYP